MLKHPVAGQTLLISLKSWRYILTLSLIGYLFTAILLFQAIVTVTAIAGIISLSAGFIALLFCWRLWMDEQFFIVFYQDDNAQQVFDFAIKTLWSKNVTPRTLEQRWLGVRRLIYRAWLAVALQWLGVLIVLVFFGFAN